MENNKENKKVKNDLVEPLNDEKKEGREEDNIEKNSSSKVGTTHFTKNHGRTHNSFGDGHEPGTIPGAGI